jgi:SM-20-related protein
MDELSQNDYVIIDQFLDTSLFCEVKSHFTRKLPEFSAAGIGALDQNAIHREVRGDLTHWLDRDRDVSLETFWGLVDETMRMFNRYCYLSISGYEFHFAMYPPGGHYDTHVDQFQGRNNRIISVIIYLNEGWIKGDGGELEIFRKDGSSLLVEPIADRCVMFKSAEVSHGVLESHINRCSLTGWLLHLPGSLGQILG